MWRLDGEPMPKDHLRGLEIAPRLPRAVRRETKRVIALARRFNDEVVRPGALELDRPTGRSAAMFFAGKGRI